MKCPNCGAEIISGKFCESCGSQITVGMQKDLEQLNKAGCPKCGSSNIAFRRENQGEIRGKKEKQIVHNTVGYCKDCGYTWQTTETQKKRKTWLWVLGWIFIFPLPLTLIMLKKKDMKPIVKYGIIAVAWVAYLLIGIGGSKNGATDIPDGQVNSVVDSSESIVDTSDTIILSWNEVGKFGKEIVLNASTDMEMSFIAFSIPAGKYKVTNKSLSGTSQVTIYSGIENDGQWDQFVADGCDDPIVVKANDESQTIEVKEGQFIKLSDGSENIEFVLQ